MRVKKHKRRVLYTYKDFKKILKKNGYLLVRKRGDHFIYKNYKGNTISINLRLNPMVARRLIKENRLLVSEEG